MITAFIFNQSISSVKLNVSDHIPENTVWLDVCCPNDAESLWLSNYVDLTQEDERQDLEASARVFYSYKDLHINSLFLQKTTSKIKSCNISFVLKGNLLVTVRDEELSLFRYFKRQLKNKKIECKTAFDVFVLIFELKIDFVSDMIGGVYGVLEDVSRDVMEQVELDKVFSEITCQEDINCKIRLCLLDTQRSIRHIMRYHSNNIDKHSIRALKEILSDIDSLLPHSQFLFEKINFLLESAIGLNGLQQNKIIKIFSLAAVIFLPPTLIASSYGMNFDVMPELDWKLGYPFALGLMFFSALGTYLFFKVKKWL